MRQRSSRQVTSIRDVAKKAGVGMGTVSWAPSGTGYAAEDTKAKILAAVERLSYQLNELIRNPFRNRTGIIGVVASGMESPFFSKLLERMEIQLYKNGYKAMIRNTIEISNREQGFIDMLCQNVMGGIITGAHSLQDYTYLDLNKSVVAMNRDLGPGIPMIHSDYRTEGRMTAQFLLDVGYKNVLSFGGSFRVHTPSNGRHQGLKQIMGENGASVRAIEMTWNMMEHDYYCHVMEQYMDIYRGTDGAFTTDIGALYCLNIANQRSAKVPERLHIVGYDTVGMTRLFTPKLTSIAQNIPGLATACVDTMMDLLDGRKVEMERIPPVSIQKSGTI